MAKKVNKSISGNTLVIVESPSKAKTIQKYLGKGYDVKASVGHIRDLPKSKLGFDDDFNPVYEVAKDKSKVISELKKQTKASSCVILATDPDREGEAIAWHVSQVLGFDETDSNRIFFTEITKDAVNDAIKHPRPIDMQLVDAQQARRILDRIVGYKLSPLLWTKIRYGLSAGRVQSVAVRLIVDRERERESFNAKEYWDLNLDCVTERLGSNGSQKTDILMIKSDLASENKKYQLSGIEFSLSKKNGKKYVPIQESEINEIIKNISNQVLKITDVITKNSKKYPKPPFTTSTLQQAAINRMGFTSKRTMSAAQKLYESGFITYMRTDSTNISQIAMDEMRGYIRKQYGDKYISPEAIYYKTRSKGAQEAHEAIRPTNIVMRTVPDTMKDDEKRLYDLIWRRTVSCQMAPAIFENTNITGNINDYLFAASGSIQVFDGFQKVYGIDFEDKIFPFEIKVNDELHISKVIGIQHFTEPPARYTEASLVKALETYGIGRPSTYASIISTILARGYVEKENKSLKPTDTGIVVHDFLAKYFPTIVDLYFTAEMENELDNIAEGKLAWKPMIKEFHNSLITQIDEKKESIKKEDLVILGDSDEKCDLCGSPMKIKLGRYGKFLTCSRFPECKGIKSLEEASNESVSLDEEKFLPAPMAKDGITQMVLKKGRYGLFFAHPDYPNVKETAPLLLKENCPECKHPLVERKGRWGKMFKGCSNYPNCKYIQGASTKKQSKKKRTTDK